MEKTSGELETEFIETAKDKTGKTLQECLTWVKSSKIKKQKDILEWLKKGHGLNHMQAQFVAGIFLNNGNPVYGNENGLLENQFAKCPDMRVLFDTISERIISEFHGTHLIPKKTYLSFTAVREFAAINIKPKEIRLGLDLGEEPFTDVLQKSKLTGPMPRISHMIILTDIKQFESKTKQFLEPTFNRTHKK